MKQLIRKVRRIISYLNVRNEPDFAATHIHTVHHSHLVGDEYLAGMPRRARQNDHLAGFPRRAIMDVIHGWKIPSPPGRLPVDD